MVSLIVESEKVTEMNLFTKQKQGTSLVVQWVRLHAPKAGGPGFDPWSEK